MNIKIMTYTDLLEEKKMLAYEVQRLRVREKNLEEANRIREKGNDVLKAEMTMQYKEILEASRTIKKMATWIKDHVILDTFIKNICNNKKVCISKNQTGTCIECIINHFKGEVKE